MRGSQGKRRGGENRQDEEEESLLEEPTYRQPGHGQEEKLDGLGSLRHGLYFRPAHDNADK